MDSYDTVDTPHFTATLDKKQAKPSWYSILKENPEALARFKECAKERYKVSKPSPEAKKRANTNYYKAHRDKIIKASLECTQKERTTEYSQCIHRKREYLRQRYAENIKTSPEKKRNANASIMGFTI